MKPGAIQSRRDVLRWLRATEPTVKGRRKFEGHVESLTKEGSGAGKASLPQENGGSAHPGRVAARLACATIVGLFYNPRIDREGEFDEDRSLRDGALPVRERERR